MRVNRLRNFKNTVELTITLTAQDCEDLSHIVSLQDHILNTMHVLYPERKRSGARLLKDLDNEVFWTHWPANFQTKNFGPRGNR